MNRTSTAHLVDGTAAEDAPAPPHPAEAHGPSALAVSWGPRTIRVWNVISISSAPGSWGENHILSTAGIWGCSFKMKTYSPWSPVSAQSNLC